jgi:hypothetical protein
VCNCKAIRVGGEHRRENTLRARDVLDIRVVCPSEFECIFAHSVCWFHAEHTRRARGLFTGAMAIRGMRRVILERGRLWQRTRRRSLHCRRTERPRYILHHLGVRDSGCVQNDRRLCHGGARVQCRVLVARSIEKGARRTQHCSRWIFHPLPRGHKEKWEPGEESGNADWQMSGFYLIGANSSASGIGSTMPSTVDTITETWFGFRLSVR